MNDQLADLETEIVDLAKITIKPGDDPARIIKAAGADWTRPKSAISWLP